VKKYKQKQAHKGIKGKGAVRVKRWGGGENGRGEGKEKIPTVNDNPTRQTSQNKYTSKNK
jgi:hypothetical protein